ncbi:UbiA family prenyltransferase [Jannaschia sp. CCS1]|uniref:UbiA family prenyltransferase n=1 Tax=Jannaschia sp. (strain CCS1) TaxID=290400 RepID=UPI000053A7B1|nr:UbiA family prenyltransferase [Jannaschia sp. CCS1]ABD57169.1 HAD-superfamily hydrolase subfamily IA variant 1 [Jannaschia sp. CCS1]
MTQNQPADATVLVVDLDGTLCRTDTLHEALLALLAQRPLAAFSILGWLREGRAAFKSHVANASIVPGDSLPLNDEVLDIVRGARAEGRRTALVTAADQRQAEAVANSVGLFDDVVGSSDGDNLKGSAKARKLVELYGEDGFDYLGDSYADIPVWSAARKAVTVGADAKLRGAAEAANPNVAHLAAPKGKARAMLKAIRPHQWSKNALLFLPLVAAHDFGALWVVGLAFLAFCFTASAVYVINDLLDLDADRAHPRKRCRPFASGMLGADTGVVLAVGLLCMAAILGMATGQVAFPGVLAVYLTFTFAYSLALKRKLIIDVLTLAGLYTVRIVAGGVAGDLLLSQWLLGFSMFLFLGLAAVKRQAELTDQLATGRESLGRAYEVDDLPILRALAVSASMAAVLVLSLYISSDDVIVLYSSPLFLWLLCPLVLYWVLRMVMATHRGKMTDDPIVFAATDRISQLIIGFAVVIVAAATFL